MSSQFVKGLKTIKDKVIFLLEKYKETQDNDPLLYLRYLQTFTDIERIGEENMRVVKKAILSAPVPESIRRIRQKLQEETKELQGTKREHRKEEGEMVRKEIKKFSLR